jgi:hypothetical protein
MRAIIVLVALGCGSKKHEEPVKQQPAPAPKPESKPTPPPPPTKQQLADYRKHMRAGWTQQKLLKWADAVPEFQAALVALPADQRALTELGWSAMNAGNYDLARSADYEALLVAVDKKVEAATLYNLGTVLARTGHTDSARRAFTSSLALRPNATVQKDLAALGDSAIADTSTTCELAKPCACIFEAAFGDIGGDSSEAACDPADAAKRLPPGWKAYRVHEMHWDNAADMLLDDRGLVIDQIGGGNLHGRHVEDIVLDKLDIQTFGAHRVLWVQTSDSEDTTLVDDTSDDMGMDRSLTTTVTLCVLGDDKTPTACPLRDVPLVETFEHSPPHGKDETTESGATVTIAPDGTASVQLVKGAASPRLAAAIGPHKLW